MFSIPRSSSAKSIASHSARTLTFVARSGMSSSARSCCAISHASVRVMVPSAMLYLAGRGELRHERAELVGVVRWEQGECFAELFRGECHGGCSAAGRADADRAGEVEDELHGDRVVLVEQAVVGELLDLDAGGALERGRSGVEGCHAGEEWLRFGHQLASLSVKNARSIGGFCSAWFVLGREKMV